MANTTVVIIPTYNEVDNISDIVERTLNANPEVDVLVVDDNSPDNTGAKADELASEHDAVNVLHREAKQGLLAAYRAGFDWAMERDYEIICQMDADGSHAPEQLDRLIDAINAGADMVIGSRYIEGSEIKEWPKERYQLSKQGNQYIALALDEDISDATAGYRAFRRDALEKIDLDDLSNKAYIFQADMVRHAVKAGLNIREVPVTFTDRTKGESKLGAGFAAQSLAEVTKWAAEDRASVVGESAKEIWRLANYQLGHSKLPEVGRKIEESPEQVITFISEIARVVGNEYKQSGIGQIPNKIARKLNDLVGTIREGGRLATYEFDHSGAGDLPGKVAKQANELVETAREGGRLANYEIKHSGVTDLPSKAAHEADAVVDTVREGARLADYEIKHL